MTLVDTLLPGEKIKVSGSAAEPKPPASDDAIEERYVNGEVRIVVEQARYPLKQVPEIVESADYNLQPDFQRRPRWARDKQSKLIESLIMNVPIPPIFLYETEYGRYEVMDGRQRLTAISEYYGNKFALSDLKEWAELNGRTYTTLPEQVRRGIDRRFLSAIVLLHETAKSAEQANKLKQMVFERINSGGEDLSAQEKRNALCPGPMNKLCLKLARNSSLCRMWGIPEPAADELAGGDWSPPAELAQNDSFRTMEDAELVLRFFAHRQRASLWKSGKRLDEFLTEYLRAANAFSSQVLGDLERLFRDAASLTYEVLGERAFYLFRAREGRHVWVERPALIVYDPMMAAFGALASSRVKLLRAKVDIVAKLEGFYTANYEAFDGRKTNLSDIRERDRLVLEFLASFI